MKITNIFTQEKIEKEVKPKQIKAEEAWDLDWFKKNEPEEQKKTTIGDYLDPALDDGTITEEEINQILEELPKDIRAELEKQGLNSEVIISELDTDENGEVSETELNKYLEEMGLGSYEEIKEKKLNIWTILFDFLPKIAPNISK